jgi:hypothetical protein
VANSQYLFLLKTEIELKNINCLYVYINNGNNVCLEKGRIFLN